jgi:hypothetical protein
MSLLNLQGFVNRDKHESMNICGGNHIVLRNISYKLTNYSNQPLSTPTVAVL